MSAAPDPGGAVLERVAFGVDGQPVSWSDVVGWMRDDGTWSAVEARAGRGLALRLADRGSPAPDALRAAARDWRYERRLLAGEELLAWLAWWGVTQSAWSEWMGDELRRQTDTTSLAPADTAALRAEAVSTDIPWVGAVCSGALQEAAVAMAGDAAAWAELGRGPLPGGSERTALLGAASAELAAGDPSPAELAAAIERQHVEWTAVDVEWAAFDHADAAREAALCCQRDGMGLADVADLAGVRHERRAALTADLETPLRSAVVTAPLGRAVVTERGAAPVTLLAWDRQPPSLDSPAVVERAAAVCRAERRRAALDRRVRWGDWPGRP